MYFLENMFMIAFGVGGVCVFFFLFFFLIVIRLFIFEQPDFNIVTCIEKTCLYNFDPLKPHFYIVKLGFTGVYIIFLISAQKH